MRPTLRQMEYVVTIHRLGRFGLAAELLNVSQPSLSAQLAAIENELGVVLFERGRTGVRTTAKGEDFVKHAQKILSAVEDLRHKMQSTSPFDGRLKLGVLPSLAPYLLPRVVRRIHHNNLTYGSSSERKAPKRLKPALRLENLMPLFQRQRITQTPSNTVCFKNPSGLRPRPMIQSLHRMARLTSLGLPIGDY